MNRLALVLLAGFGFGSSTVAVRIALAEVDPIALGVLRLGVAAIIFVPFLFLRRRTLARGRDLITVALLGVSYVAIPVLLFTLALRSISSGVQGVLLATMPLLTAVGAHWLLPDERLSSRRLLGLGLGLFGVAVMIGTRTDGLGATAFDARSYLFSFGGVLLVAVSIICGRLRLRKQDPLGVAGLQTLTALLVLAPTPWLFSLVDGSVRMPQLTALSPATLASILYMAVFGSVVPFIATFALIKRYGATDSALSGYVIPVAAASLGVVVLGERVSVSLILAGVLISVGVFLITRSRPAASESRRVRADREGN